jgi:hypothetical protein
VIGGQGHIIGRGNRSSVPNCCRKWVGIT